MIWPWSLRSLSLTIWFFDVFCLKNCLDPSFKSKHWKSKPVCMWHIVHIFHLPVPPLQAWHAPPENSGQFSFTVLDAGKCRCTTPWRSLNATACIEQLSGKNSPGQTYWTVLNISQSKDLYYSTCHIIILWTEFLPCKHLDSTSVKSWKAVLQFGFQHLCTPTIQATCADHIFRSMGQ